MPHVQGHGGDFGAQYSQQIADTASKIRGLENTKTFQQIVNEAANQQLQNIQDQQGQPGFETTLLDDQGRGQITADFGKRSGKFNDIRDKLNTQGYGALNEAEKSIANFYLGITGGKGSVPTNFEKAIDDFIKFQPGGAEAYKADQGLLGAFNVAMTNLPEAIAEKSILGNIISGALNRGRDVADFAGGLFPGAGSTFEGIARDLAAAPAGIKEDFTTMLGVNKDDNPVKSVLREELDIKKNTSNDISPDTFMDETTEPFYGGRSPSDELFASQTLPANPNLTFGRQFNRMNQGPEFARYIDRVMKNLGIESNDPQQTSSSNFLINQSKNLNAPSLDDLKQLAELNASQRAVLDQRANRFAFDQGLSTPEDMLNKIRPLDRSGIFGFGGNEANLQDIIDFYKNNPTTQI
jgi:hypothetical protein